ncbi:MAG: RagB/SusD family nutrient uptake outer membrane protein [Bacteroidota bacterium]|nr:RagB/SusD family nutrient uptake outer membrane protein [Bacteroidota bacterium]
MKKFNHIYTILAFAPFLIISSCMEFETDLEVENLENPDDQTLNFDASAIEATASGLYQNFYMTTSSTDGLGFATNTAADVSTCSWGNFGMRDISSEPRVAYNNTTSYPNAVIIENPFSAYYSILADANTVLAQVNEGADFSQPKLIETIAKFTQALTLGYNALFFDKVWLSDETGTLNDGEPVNYEEGMTFALKKLDEAINLADNNTFTVPDNWFPGNSMTNVELSQLMNSYGARMLTLNSRNSVQKSTTNWNRVLSYANNGIKNDFSILHDDTTWYDSFKTYLVYPGWARIDMYVINLMDSNTPDYWPSGEVTIPPSTSDDSRLVTDFEYLDSQAFRPERGEYHYSSYRYSRYDNYITQWTVATPEIYKAEVDLYRAEAQLHLGNIAAAADLINAGTRVNRGNLPPVSIDASAVADAIHYERMVEMPILSSGLSFFEMRKEDLLQSGTLLHFPAPASALQAIPADSYTFGGTTGVAGEDYSNGGWR